MRIVFIGLHLAWFGVSCFFLMHGRRNVLVDPDFQMAAVAVLSYCISVSFARKTLLSIGLGIPYLLGLSHMISEMTIEMRYVLAHHINPWSTYATFGLGLLSAGSWLCVIWLFSRSHSMRKSAVTYNIKSQE